jgi:hypothetical protein
VLGQLRRDGHQMRAKRDDLRQDLL